MSQQQTLNPSFWETDWGRIIKIVFSGLAIALTGGLVYAFVKRNQRFAPARMVNREIAQSLVDKTRMTVSRHPDKMISVSAVVSDKTDPYSTFSQAGIKSLPEGDVATMTTSATAA